LIDLLVVLVLIALSSILSIKASTPLQTSVSVVDETISLCRWFRGGLTAGTPITAAQFKLGTAG